MVALMCPDPSQWDRWYRLSGQDSTFEVVVYLVGCIHVEGFSSYFSFSTGGHPLRHRPSFLNNTGDYPPGAGRCAADCVTLTCAPPGDPAPLPSARQRQTHNGAVSGREGSQGGVAGRNGCKRRPPVADLDNQPEIAFNLRVERGGRALSISE